jgi:hypothetical protein
MDAQVLNFKPYQSGAMVGFFDLEVSGLVVTGCKCFRKDDRVWFAWPSEKVPGENGEAAYRDIVCAADPVMRHLQNAVRGQLRTALESPRPPASRPPSKFKGTKFLPLAGEDLGEHGPAPIDDIPF